MRIAEASGYEKMTGTDRRIFLKREHSSRSQRESLANGKKVLAFSYDSVTLLPYIR